jgi:hypothetical protein
LTVHVALPRLVCKSAAADCLRHLVGAHSRGK